MKVFQKALLLSVLSLGLSKEVFACPPFLSQDMRGEGTYHVNQSQSEVIRLTLQEFMTTTVVLPSNEKIIDINIGDSNNFETLKESAHVFLIKPKGVPGSESRIVVHTKSGRIYNFYVRSETFNSKTIPDLKVVVHGGGESSPIRDLTKANTEKQASPSTNLREELRNLQVTLKEMVAEQKKFHRDYLRLALPRPDGMGETADKLVKESLADLEASILKDSPLENSSLKEKD